MKQASKTKVKLVIPPGVWVNGKLWEVSLVQDLYKDDEEFGNCRYHKLLIEIDQDQSEQHARDTLWHEILHGIERELDLKITEKQVRQIASMQVAVMRDNADLMTYLLAPTAGEG